MDRRTPLRLLRRLEGPQTLGRGPAFWGVAALAVALAAAYPLVTDSYTVGNTIYFFDWVFMALGLCLVWGYGGALSFGQTAFFGLSGYAYGVLTLDFGADHGLTLVATLVAVAASALFAAVLGYFLFFGRISGVFLGIVTLAVTLVFERFMAQTAGPEWHVGAARLNGFAGRFAAFPATAALFGAPAAARAGRADSLWQPGDRLVQTDLGRTLLRIRDAGADGFYRGATADAIVAEMERGGGLVTHADLAAYRPVERAPVVGTYRGHRVLSMPPPSSGGVALVQMLNAVEAHDLGALGLGSSASLHLMGEAMRRAYADRAEWLGDPDFVAVPVDGLTAKAYAARRMADFDPARASGSEATGPGAPPESPQTTHLSVVDDDGFAVSLTTTLNGAYGSLVSVPGAGFLLNNEMDDFSAKPGTPNMFGLVGAEANAIAPGKRMLSSMTPTIVEDPEGRLRLVAGSPGGGRIITTVFQVVTNVLDHGLDVQAAVAAPRVHHQWLPDVLFAEDRALAADVAAALAARGWRVQEDGQWSRADAIEVVYDAVRAETDPSGLETTARRRAGRAFLGGADPRGEDVAVGW